MLGRLNGLSYTRDGDCLLTISTREDCGPLMDELSGADVDIAIKKYKKHRSLDANAMYWASLTKLARKLSVSNAYMHNSMLRQYGQPELFDGKVAYIMLPDTEESEQKAMEADTYHLRPTSQTKQGSDGITYRAYMLIRGSSTYNTEEFARLLDGLIEACNEAGIRVMTGRRE